PSSDYLERIASPAAHAFGLRPYLKIDFGPTGAVVPPDLTLGGSEIRPSDPTPSVGQLLQIGVTVTNVGPTLAQNVPVRLYDGDPQNGGVAIGATQTIPSIQPAGGKASAQFAWTATAGAHALHAIVDPGNVVPELDETNNHAFTTLAVQK